MSIIESEPVDGVEEDMTQSFIRKERVEAEFTAITNAPSSVGKRHFVVGMRLLLELC